MEVLLETIIEQRTLHIERLAKAKDPRVRGRSRWTAAWTLAFSEDDISTLMNECRLDVEKWTSLAIVETFWGTED